MSFLFTSGLKKIVSNEGALNSRPGTDAQVDEGLSSVFRVSVKTAYVLHSLTQGVLGPQLGGVFFSFFSSRFYFYLFPIENQRFFFFHSLRVKIFFSGQSKNKLFFSKQHICSKCIRSNLYARVFLEPNIHGYNIRGYIVYMFVLGPRM